MTPELWFLLSLPVGFLALLTIFLAVMNVKRVHRAGVKLHWAIKYPTFLIGGFGWCIDVALNWSVAMLTMGPSLTLTLSSRFKRIRKRNIQGYRRKVANWFCENLLNPFDEGHC